MRVLLLLSVLLCAGCGDLTPAAGALAGADLASVAVFGRGITDIGVSAVTGKDCSVVRLDKGETYCAPRQPVSNPGEPYCTRSLGVVDCWANPTPLVLRSPSVGDTPPPTPLQQEYRRAPWPKSLNAGL